MPHQFTLERFQGPLDLLLKLIEQQELNISDVALATVTEQYLQYLEQEPDLPPEDLADFLVVAARLLLLKSRLLLPTLFVDELEPDEESLTRQLALYRMYVAASAHLSDRLRRRTPLYARQRTAAPLADTPFSPPPSLTRAVLSATFQHIIEDLARYVKPMPGLISRTVSLQEKVRAVRMLLDTRSGEVDFHDVMRSSESRTEIIITFLALLELVKQRYVVVRQDSHHAPIKVSRIQPEEVPV